MGSLFKIAKIDGRRSRKGRWLSAVGCRLSAVGGCRRAIYPSLNRELAQDFRFDGISLGEEVVT